MLRFVILVVIAVFAAQAQERPSAARMMADLNGLRVVRFVSAHQEVKIAGRAQMMQAGSNSSQSAYPASPETLSDPLSDREGSAATILPEAKVAAEV